jgi:hypothetical protein
VVLGSYGLKNLRRRKASGLKKKKLEQSNPLKTSSLSLLKKAMI